MLTKTSLRQCLETLPEEFSLDELIERLVLVKKIEKGMKQSQRNQVIPVTALDMRMQKWLI